MDVIRSDANYLAPAASTGGFSTPKSLFLDVLNDLSIHPKSLNMGEDQPIYFMFVCLLDMLKGKLQPSDFKYKTRADFLNKYLYPPDVPDLEKELLWQSANWMNVLFKLRRANASLTLTIGVIAKFVEGLRGSEAYFFLFNSHDRFLLLFLDSKVHYRRRHDVLYKKKSTVIPLRGKRCDCASREKDEDAGRSRRSRRKDASYPFARTDISYLRAHADVSYYRAREAGPACEPGSARQKAKDAVSRRLSCLRIHSLSISWFFLYGFSHIVSNL